MTEDNGTSDGSGDAGDEPTTSRRPGRLDVQQQRERLAVQVNIILQGVRGAAVHPADSLENMEFHYHQDRILVRDEDLARVRAVVPGDVVDPLVNGLSVFAPKNLAALDALEELDSVLGVGVATPDHIFHVASPIASCCPATEPDPVASTVPDPPVANDPAVGRGALVAVVDTGFIPALDDPAHSWLAGVTGEDEPYDPSNIGPYVGHGTFVAGVVRSMAPGAEVQVEGLLTQGGAVTESEILRGLTKAMDLMPDVISMSAGCTTRHNLPPLAFEVLWERRLRHYKGTVLVVAAGNSATRQPFWPAAYEWAVSVGALDRAGDRAWFSNFGSWVDVYALGVDIVNAHPNGTYHYREPPRIGETSEFTNGMARWSGTSFSTPMVSGMIAARMSRTGQSARHAADDILRIAQANATPGVGPIADPSQTFNP
jgi:subtilisin family serine protease